MQFDNDDVIERCYEIFRNGNQDNVVINRIFIASPWKYGINFIKNTLFGRKKNHIIIEYATITRTLSHSHSRSHSNSLISFARKSGC